MAQALRTVWLEPEDQRETSSPLLRPRKRQRMTSANRQSPLAVMRMVAVVAFVVGLAAIYVNCNARIAQYNFQRQAKAAELRQLQTECATLSIEIARLENTPQITELALGQGLVFPSADRVHYVKVANDSPQSTFARTTPHSGQRSWLARTSHQTMARLDTVFQRLSRGPGTPAYAQD